MGYSSELNTAMRRLVQGYSLQCARGLGVKMYSVVLNAAGRDWRYFSQAYIGVAVSTHLWPQRMLPAIDATVFGHEAF